MHTHELVLATLLLQEVNQRIGKCLPEVEWTEDEGLQFCDAQSIVESLGHGLLDRAGTDQFRRTEFEFLRIDTGIRNHYHNHTDAVVIVLDATPNPYVWDVVLEKPLPPPGGYDLWHLPLAHGQLILLPREVVHGFTPHHQADGRPLYLLVASCPGHNLEDTFYVGP